MAPKGRKLSELGIKDSKFLQTARTRWKAADDADVDQSTREQEDLAFYDDQQWPADIMRMRGPQPAANGMPAALGRPTLVINKVREPVRQVQNEIRASEIGIELVPADDFGDLGVTLDDTEITLREGLIRRIQRESEAQEARNWAGDRATIAGRGYYLVMTRFLPGKTFDQEIYVHRIYNQAGVKLDPAHEQPDGSDADWGFIGTWMPWDKFQSLYPNLADGSKNPFSDAGEAEFIGMTEQYPDWYNAENERQAIRVVDYWYTERTARELAILSDGKYVWTDELPKEKGKNGKPIAPRGTEIIDTRTVIESAIKFCKIAGGVLILEETDWPGPDLPIIKVLGEEIQPYDEQRRAEGMVRPARDAQKSYNYMISKLVETVGLTPIPPLQVDPDAIEGYKAWYQNANVRPLPYLPSRTYDDFGRVLKEPHRPNVDPNLQPMAVALNVFDESIKNTTMVPNSSMGQVDPALKSGKAIREVVANAKQSTSNFLDNRVRSTRREGTIINNLLYPIYGARPGRLVRILTGESGEQQQYAIGDPNDAALRERAAQVARLTPNAHFNVVVKVTKEYESRRQQETAVLGDMISMNPEFMTWFGDKFFINSDIPGRKELAERAKAMLAPPIQEAEAAKQGGAAALPPAARQQIQQMQQQIAMAEAAMAEMRQELEGKRLESQTKLQTEQMKSNTDLQIELMNARLELLKTQMDNATKLRVAEIAAETKGVVDANRLEHEAMALAHETQHEASEAQQDREHDRAKTTATMAHQAAMADGQADRAERENERSRQATASENDKNRKAQPKPKK